MSTSTGVRKLLPKSVFRNTMTSQLYASEFQNKSSFFTREIYTNITIKYNIKLSDILVQEIFKRKLLDHNLHFEPS